MTHFSSTRLSKFGCAFAVAAAPAASLAAFPAFAQEQAAPTTGSHIDPNARPVMLPTIQAGGAIEAAKAVPVEASEARVQRPQITEVDAGEWLPADQNKAAK